MALKGTGRAAAGKPLHCLLSFSVFPDELPNPSVTVGQSTWQCHPSALFCEVRWVLIEGSSALLWPSEGARGDRAHLPI